MPEIKKAPSKDEVKPSFDALLSGKAKEPIPTSARPHMSMQVNPMEANKLESTPKPKEIVDPKKAVKPLDVINSDSDDEQFPEVLQKDDPRLDQLLPEEDPDNYLAKLQQSYNPVPVVVTAADPQESTTPTPLVEDSDMPIVHDTKYMQDFYLVMHEDIIIREKEEEAKERERRDREKLEE